MRLVPLSGEPTAARRELSGNPRPDLLDESAAGPQRQSVLSLEPRGGRLLRQRIWGHAQWLGLPHPPTLDVDDAG